VWEVRSDNDLLDFGRFLLFLKNTDSNLEGISVALFDAEVMRHPNLLLQLLCTVVISPSGLLVNN
jgi:hypothetical protein